MGSEAEDYERESRVREHVDGKTVGYFAFDRANKVIVVMIEAPKGTKNFGYVELQDAQAVLNGERNAIGLRERKI